MTLGKVLWTVILIKLFVIFFVLKLFFFPNVLDQKSNGDKASYVAGELTGDRGGQIATCIGRRRWKMYKFCSPKETKYKPNQ